MFRLLLLASALLAAFSAVAEEPVIPTVESNYSRHCASCHGKDGKGLTKIGRTVHCRDYTDPDVVASLKDDIAVKRIKEGMRDKVGKELMPPFGTRLTDSEVKALLAYMKTFARK